MMKLQVPFRHAAPAMRRLIPSLALAAALAGCGADIEENALFREQQKTVARLDDETKSIGRQVEDISLTVATIRQDFKEMKNAPGGNAQLANDLALRLQEIQDVLRDNTTRLAQLEMRMNKEMKTQTVASAKPEAEAENDADDAPAKPAKEVAKASSSDGPRSVQVKVTRKSSESEPPAKPKGKYYVVQDGDSPEQIARKHNVTVASLMTANGIPGGRTVKFPSGQKIFVPASN